MKKTTLLNILLISTSVQANDYEQACTLAGELSGIILTKRIVKNTSKPTAKIFVKYLGSTLDKDMQLLWNDFVKVQLEDVVERAYQQPLSKNEKQNKRTIKRFIKQSRRDCLNNIAVRNQKAADKIKALEAKVEILEREEKNKSGQFFGMTTSTNNLTMTHTIQCKVGHLGTVIQIKENGFIFSYINKNGLSYRNHDFSLTLSEAARLACK